mmetsp:Transcript_13069/g.30799  ORF Transcript_13069/g.30799 Transcript_13069/m.30799 type:complete len:143 (+) Transcript_13069:96-524(+)
MSPRHVPRILFLLMPLVCCFHDELRRFQRPKGFLKSSYSNNDFGDDNGIDNANNNGQAFPSSFSAHDAPLAQNHSEPEKESGNSRSEGQANTRFSAFAPDPSLEASDFRAQLRENMKADLERRRHEDPNRGNQIAKSYLDSL